MHAACIASVVNGIWNRSLNTLRQFLLELLGDLGRISTILGVRFVGRLARKGTSRVDLKCQT